VKIARRLALMLAAFLASAAAVVPIVLLMIVFALNGRLSDPVMLDYAAIAFILVNMLTFVPASLIVAVAEWKRIRSWGYFVTAGGLIALVLTTLFGFSPSPGNGGASLYLGAFLFAAGLIAGFIYWAIAGRHAGALRDAWASRRAA